MKAGHRRASCRIPESRDPVKALLLSPSHVLKTPEPIYQMRIHGLGKTHEPMRGGQCTSRRRPTWRHAVGICWHPWRCGKLACICACVDPLPNLETNNAGSLGGCTSQQPEAPHLALAAPDTPDEERKIVTFALVGCCHLPIDRWRWLNPSFSLNLDWLEPGPIFFVCSRIAPTSATVVEGFLSQIWHSAFFHLLV